MNTGEGPAWRGRMDITSLRGIPLFQEVAQSELEYLVRGANWHRSRRGQAILEPLEATGNVFIVLEGRVLIGGRAPGGKEVDVLFLGSGDVIDLNDLPAPLAEYVYVEADSEEVVACRISRPAFRQAVFSHPASAADYFWYGADSNAPTAIGSGPYYMPSPIGSGDIFAVYTGEVGTWQDIDCGNWSAADNATDEKAADWEFNNYSGTFPNLPEGTADYFYLGGPGADPSFNPSTYTNSMAYGWGQSQAQTAYNHWLNGWGPDDRADLMFMDIEYNSGWDEWVYSSGSYCGSVRQQTYIQPGWDRNTFNGFFDYMNSRFHAGVYSSQSFWVYTMGGSCSTSNPDACIQGVPQWTSESESGSITPGPSGWCQNVNGTNYCAQWFGHVNSNEQLMWQWSEANNSDWDQSDSTNFPLG